MSSQSVIASVVARFQAGLKTRILAFGSSNTERFLAGTHWFDVLDLAVKHTYGRVHHCINTGIGGHSSRLLLQRFEHDAEFYRPHLVIITVGGNDSLSQENGLSEEEFDANLRELRRRFAEMGCAVVFQTYYAADPAQIGAESVKKFNHYMSIIRKVAAETNSGLVDHNTRWEALKKADNARYVSLMRDGLHVNWKGNLVLGLDLAREFGATCPVEEPEYWREALEAQAVMDRECEKA